MLERQTSLSKHFLAHYGKGAALLEKHLNTWQETSKAKEELPACVEFLLDQQNGVRDGHGALAICILYTRSEICTCSVLIERFAAVFFCLFQTGSEHLYALPRTPVLTLEDETDNFCSASQMRKSSSIHTSYLYDEAQATFTETVNPKIYQVVAAEKSARNNGGSGSSNLCKSKSEYNLAFVSPTRSGYTFGQPISPLFTHKDYLTMIRIY